MDPIISAVIVAWLFMRGYEAVKGEWTHTRDRYATDVARQHKDWSPGRVNRAARWRARGYWWHEISNGFPTFRQAWKEHALAAKAERAEAGAEGETRLAELRERLEKARQRIAGGKDAGDPAPPGDAGVLTDPPDAGMPALPDAPPDEEGGTGEPVPPHELWTGDPAPESFWRDPSVPPCEACGGTGEGAGIGNIPDACPVCRGFGEAPPDPDSPVAQPGTVCAACGHPPRPDDPVLVTTGGMLHRSHAIEQTWRYREALEKTQAPPVAANGSPAPDETEGEQPMADTTTVEDAETPYEGLLAVTDAAAKNARETAQQFQDDVMAYAVTHGFDRDQQVMGQLQQAADAAEAHATAAEATNRALAANHAEGAEYHGTGQDAHASAFRPA